MHRELIETEVVDDRGNPLIRDDPRAASLVEGMMFFKLVEKLKQDDDADAAIAHAGEEKSNPAVVALLRRVRQPKLLEGCGPQVDYRRFRGIMPILGGLAGVDTGGTWI
mmetsp:Transcript_19246/g.48184  ORF Transcript_19246/g.48184 Transcript_19246/m.48184 type:complete len:109 (+) Transcript_19246:386-712(+)